MVSSNSPFSVSFRILLTRVTASEDQNRSILVRNSLLQEWFEIAVRLEPIECCAWIFTVKEFVQVREMNSTDRCHTIDFNLLYLSSQYSLVLYAVGSSGTTSRDVDATILYVKTFEFKAKGCCPKEIVGSKKESLELQDTFLSFHQFSSYCSLLLNRCVLSSVLFWRSLSSS